MHIMKAIQTGFFTHEIQLHRIDEIGGLLSAISQAIDFESFRPILNTLLGTSTGRVGRPPWDQVLMLRVLVLQIIHAKGFRDKPLSAIEVEMNHLKSKVRVRIEHRFGRMKTCFHGLAIRGIRLVRNCSTVGLFNLVYSMLEYSILQSLGPSKA